jgi:small subunit ribosomal protein S2
MEDNQNLYPEEASREMIEARVFFGRRKSKANPKMRPYILTNRAGIEIINLMKTSEALERALGFLKEKIKNGGLALLVGTQPPAEEEIIRVATKFGLPYVTTRWAGGTLTNFKIVSKRIEYLKKLENDFATGALEKYTKKERLQLERELGRLRDLFGGLKVLIKEPDILLIIDPNLHSTAVREARRLKIPVIALANVDSDPDSVDYLVPGNDKSTSSIGWFLKKLEETIEQALVLKANAKKLEEEEAEKSKESLVKANDK